MSRLHTELQRLFALTWPAADGPGAPMAAEGPLTVPVDPAADTRLMVLGLGRPADWPRLEAVWQAVQAELGLPAPAIAVNGSDGFQLWFALARPVPPAQAAGFLEALRLRHLGDLPPGRVSALPALAGGPQALPRPHALPLVLPGGPSAPDQWSAFVAPDLAPMFAETPWLDLPPPLEGQAELLARLQPAPAEAFERACARLAPPPAPAPTAPVATAGPPAPADPPATAAHAALADEARHFLQRVMNDEQAALALRIEAAKALLYGR